MAKPLLPRATVIEAQIEKLLPCSSAPVSVHNWCSMKDDEAVKTVAAASTSFGDWVRYCEYLAMFGATVSSAATCSSPLDYSWPCLQASSTFCLAGGGTSAPHPITKESSHPFSPNFCYRCASTRRF